MTLQDDVNIIKELESFSSFMVEDFRNINAQLSKVKENQISLLEKSKDLDAEFLNFRKNNKVKCVFHEKRKPTPSVEDSELTESKMREIYNRISNHKRLENENFSIYRFDSEFFKKNQVEEEVESESSDFSVVYQDPAESIYQESIAIQSSVLQSVKLEREKSKSIEKISTAPETLKIPEQVLDETEVALFDSEEEIILPKKSELKISPKNSRAEFYSELSEKSDFPKVEKTGVKIQKLDFLDEIKQKVGAEIPSPTTLNKNTGSQEKSRFLTASRPKNLTRKPPSRKSKQIRNEVEEIDNFFEVVKLPNPLEISKKTDSISSIDTDELFE